MSAKPEHPETAGDPSNTTVHGALIDHTEQNSQPEPGTPHAPDFDKPTDRDPAQATAHHDSVSATDMDLDQTRHPSVRIDPTVHYGDSSPETRQSNDIPSLTSAQRSFHGDDLGGGFMPGQVIFDLYVAKRKLGEGGMGQVWLVNHRELNVDRALKLIISRVSYDAHARARFRREAQVLARLNHPNAVTVHNARLTDDDIAYIEMEYVPGESLDKIFKSGYPMPLKWVARVADQLCSVLHAAHEQGIVHRDLKPANLMLLEGRPEGEEFLKVLDFGIAKVLEHNTLESELRTGTGMFVGTVAYASPEQLLGSAEPRSDLYSVGVILYEFLTGRRPYLGNANTILQQAVMGNPPAFIEANPDIDKFEYPPELEALVIRCLSKEPNDRPQTARELATLFREAVKIDVAPVVPPAPLVQAPPARSRAMMGVMAFASCAVVALAILIAKSGGGSRVDPDRTPETRITSVAPAGFNAAADSKVVADGKASIIVPAKLDPGIGLRLIFLPGKTFKMGAGALQHDETVGDFYMSETEITNRQMIAYFTAKGISSRPKVWSDMFQELMNQGKLSEAEALEHPAAGISYTEAADFAQWIGAALPTEAEWEYAATCGGLLNRRYPWPYPEELQQGMGRANIDTVSELRVRTSRAKSYVDDKTDQGIYDLAGNLREWCRTETSPTGPFFIRGGSWNTGAREYSNQEKSVPMPKGNGEIDLGFRVVVEMPGK